MSQKEKVKFFLIFCLFGLVLIIIKRKKEKLFRFVYLVYLPFLKSERLLDSIASYK